MSIKSLYKGAVQHATLIYAVYYDWMNKCVLRRFLKVVTEEAVRMSDGKHNSQRYRRTDRRTTL